MRINWSLIIGLMLMAMLGGCKDNVIVNGHANGYLQLTSPENLVNNLQESYRRREIEKYAELLAPEYIFRVQPVDVADYGPFFTRDRDSTGTEALFSTPLVSSIRIDLTHGPATVPTESGFPTGTMKIRIQPTFLEVDETTGTTWQVDGDIQDLFFRLGKSSDGENPNHWFIIEWRDLPGGATAFRQGKDAPQSTAPGKTTWGAIKGQYGN